MGKKRSEEEEEDEKRRHKHRHHKHKRHHSHKHKKHHHHHHHHHHHQKRRGADDVICAPPKAASSPSLSPPPPKRTGEVPFFAAAAGCSPSPPRSAIEIPVLTAPPPSLMSLSLSAPPADGRLRKSRWAAGGDADKACIPGMPTSIPANLTREQEQVYILQLQIEESTYRLRLLEQGVLLASSSSSAAAGERSPSPEPTYDLHGRRTNTRDARTKKRLEDERHAYVQKLIKIRPDYKPPIDYKPMVPRFVEKVVIPQNEYVEINFLGILIGPRGNSLKKLEQETGAKIVIRGRGSSKDIRIQRDEADEDVLHAQITGVTPEIAALAADKIREVIRKGIEEPETLEERRKTQLRELAILNGTYRENETLSRLKMLAEAESIVTNTIICAICAGAGHVAADCLLKGDELEPFNPRSDPEYVAMMKDLGADVCPSMMGREYALLQGITGASANAGRIKAAAAAAAAGSSGGGGGGGGGLLALDAPPPAAATGEDSAALMLAAMRPTDPSRAAPVDVSRFDFSIGLDSAADREEEFARFMDDSAIKQDPPKDDGDPFGCRAAGIDPVAVGLVAPDIDTTNASFQPHLAAALAAFTPANTRPDPAMTQSANASAYYPSAAAAAAAATQQYTADPTYAYMVAMVQQYMAYQQQQLQPPAPPDPQQDPYAAAMAAAAMTNALPTSHQLISQLANREDPAVQLNSSEQAPPPDATM